MDLLAIIRTNIESLPDGEHLVGLRSVLRHIETAEAHLFRGQQQEDDTAFTDAIYRTNQAFEGGIKEAYRVLAGKDPSKAEPYKIEKYLQTNSIFRDRVLAQFKTYRTEWRNPSTHDYNLNFDAGEALLAITTISTFTNLLVDQIDTRSTYNEVSEQPENTPPTVLPRTSISALDRIVSLSIEFLRVYVSAERSSISDTENRFTSAFLAYLAAAAPDLALEADVAVDAEKRRRVDVVVKDGDDVTLLEIKGAYRRLLAEQAIEQMREYLSGGTVATGALILFRGRSQEDWAAGDVTKMELAGLVVRTVLLAPPRSEEYWGLDRSPP